MEKAQKKFKLVSLLGIRPDYIRMAKLIKLLDEGQEKYGYEHVLVHSGQHYDPELFGNFLKEFDLRDPDFDLGVGLSLKDRGVSNHAYQVSLLSERVYDFIQEHNPDCIMYLGDTNTVLSSPTVARCGIPVVHIEAGGRSFDWRMPEEKNRIVIDHLSDHLYSYLDRYKDILLSEGVEDSRVTVIGNIIVDAIEEYAQEIEASTILNTLGVKEKEFILITLHREENTINPDILKQKLSDIAFFAKEKGMPVVFPLMPRVAACVEEFGLHDLVHNEPFMVIKPAGFFDFLSLEKNARLIISDSGTVQEEALIVGTPCVIARRSTERPETMWAGATILEGIDETENLLEKMERAWNMPISWDRNILNPEGGSPSQRVFDDLVNKINNNYFTKSRDFDQIQDNPFVKDAYGISR